MKTLDDSKLVYSKNHFNLEEKVILSLFQLTGIQADYSLLEQRSVIKILVAEKCKPYDFTKEYVT